MAFTEFELDHHEKSYGYFFVCSWLNGKEKDFIVFP